MRSGAVWRPSRRFPPTSRADRRRPPSGPCCPWCTEPECGSAMPCTCPAATSTWSRPRSRCARPSSKRPGSCPWERTSHVRTFRVRVEESRGCLPQMRTQCLLAVRKVCHQQRQIGRRGQTPRGGSRGPGRQGWHFGSPRRPAMHLQIMPSWCTIKLGGAVLRISEPHFP